MKKKCAKSAAGLQPRTAVVGFYACRQACAGSWELAPSPVSSLLRCGRHVCQRENIVDARCCSPAGLICEARGHAPAPDSCFFFFYVTLVEREVALYWFFLSRDLDSHLKKSGWACNRSTRRPHIAPIFFNALAPSVPTYPDSCGYVRYL